MLMPIYKTTRHHISEVSNPKTQDMQIGPAYLGHSFKSLPIPFDLRFEKRYIPRLIYPVVSIKELIYNLNDENPHVSARELKMSGQEIFYSEQNLKHLKLKPFNIPLILCSVSFTLVLQQRYLFELKQLGPCHVNVSKSG
jgi:hypothetical protein